MLLPLESIANVKPASQHFQPSQSFEYRGVSLFIQKAKEKHGRDLHIVSASGSNAALAAACASKSLFLSCTVFITQDTSQDVIEFLKREDAKVVIEGNSYSKVLKKAKAAVAANPNAYVSASRAQTKSGLHKRTQDPRSRLRRSSHSEWPRIDDPRDKE